MIAFLLLFLPRGDGIPILPSPPRGGDDKEKEWWLPGRGSMFELSLALDKAHRCPSHQYSVGDGDHEVNLLAEDEDCVSPPRHAKFTPYGVHYNNLRKAYQAQTIHRKLSHPPKACCTSRLVSNFKKGLRWKCKRPRRDQGPKGPNGEGKWRACGRSGQRRRDGWLLATTTLSVVAAR
jgi:hypothetical protein